MLSKSIIKYYTKPITYRRGVQIYAEGRILSFHVDETEDTDWIDAEVRGSGRNIYHVSMGVEKDMDEPKEISCECPAYDTYQGLCKHCVAVLLRYLDYARVHKEEVRRERALEALAPMKGMRLRTTPVIKELLQKQAVKRTLPILQEEVYGKVHLKPYLTCNHYSVELEFQLGVSRMYVLKDVLEFANQVEEQSEFSYGQKLTFYHAKNAFDEESRPLVDFICWWAQNYKKNRPTMYHSSSKVRTMQLSGMELEEFLLAVGEQSFYANVMSGGERQWCVTKDELVHNMKITGDQFGVQLSISHLTGIKGNKYYCYFVEGVIYMDTIERIRPIADFIDCMKLSSDCRAYIAAEDVPVFCRELLPELKKVYRLEIDSFDAKNYGVIPVEFEIYLDAPQPDFITCKVVAAYGERHFNVFESAENKTEGIRDLLREAQVAKLVADYCNALDKDNGYMVIGDDEEKLYQLIAHGIAAFQEVAQVYVSDSLKKINIQKSPQVTVGVSLAGDTLELSLTSEEMSQDELIDVLSRYQVKKRYYRLKSGDFVHLDEDSITVLQELKQDMNLSNTQLKKKVIQLPKYHALYLDHQLDDNHEFSFHKDKSFRALIRNMKTVKDNDFDVPASLDSVLRHYQKEGFRWLKTLQQNGFSGILADDMGLGKTLQVIAFLLSSMQEAAGENRRSLVIAPASLVYNWKSEMQRFAPELNVIMVTGKLEERAQMIRGAGEQDILLTSYDLMKRDLEEYEQISFFCEIIDEAQYIKNHNTKAARAVKSVEASFKIALTGTPLENKLSELWSIFDYLMPGFLHSYARFRQELEQPIVLDEDARALARLQKMIGPFVLRRLKKDVLKDLPDKLEENVFAAMEGEQQKLYDARVQRMKLMLEEKSEEEFKTGKIQILAELTRLRQLCCDPSLVYEDYKGNSAKLDMCIDLVENAIGGGHKILLFSQFTSMLQNIQDRMEARGISFYTLTGHTSKEKRAKLVAAFNEDDTSVFCISLKAGGTGLNLAAADVVIHYDPWWNVAVQSQATDRAHRIGQTNVVNVYKLVMKDSIEENIIRLQDKKKELAEQVLNGAELSGASFTREELLALLER